MVWLRVSTAGVEGALDRDAELLVSGTSAVAIV